MEAIAEKIYTAEEYLTLTSDTNERYEFVDGELNYMAGESPIANEIAGNLYIFFKGHLRGKPYKIYEHVVKLQVQENKVYRLPDFFIVHATGVRQKLVTEPILIVEVLSDSTEDIDRRKKLREYTALPTLHYYLLVDQKEMVIEVYRRREQAWEYSFFTNLTDEIELPALDTILSVSTVYEGIDFNQL